LALKGNDSKYIYYFGGCNTESAIHRFNLATKSTVKLSAILPTFVYHAAGDTKNQSAFIFNSEHGNIMEFNTTSETVKEIGKMSLGNGPVFSTASITDSTSTKTWLFSDPYGKPNNSVEIFNFETRLTSNPDQNVSVPSLSGTPATVSAGRYGYIIGGFGRRTGSGGTKHHSHGILR
jgi:hypothetical protein